MGTYTSLAIMRNLVSDLKLRLPSTYIFTESTDVNDPVLTIAQDATWATTDFWVVLKLVPVGATDETGQVIPELRVNSLGLAQTTYVPHQLNIAVENVLTDTNGAPVLTHPSWHKMMVEINKRALSHAIWWVAEDTAAPVVGDITGAPDIGPIYPDIRWPVSLQA